MEEQIIVRNQNRVSIRNGVVHRPNHPWSDGTRQLLQFFRAQGGLSICALMDLGGFIGSVAYQRNTPPQ